MQYTTKVALQIIVGEYGKIIHETGKRIILRKEKLNDQH